MKTLKTLRDVLKNRIQILDAKSKDAATGFNYETAFSFVERAKEIEVLLVILTKKILDSEV